VLARLFVDDEPGIHWPQVHMQSGHTGINVPRMYNPLKQSRDQDPAGDFIRRWVPALAGCVGDAVHAPWVVGGVRGYPPPGCDVTAAMRAARARLAAVYGHPDFPAIARAVYERHGSRGRPVRPVPRMREARPESAAQLALPGVVDG
jgi:deoxyribodipyrimidine photo-lyase